MVVEAVSKIPLQALLHKGSLIFNESSYPDSYPLFEGLQHFCPAKVSFPFVGDRKANWDAPPTHGSLRNFGTGSSQR